MATIKLSVLPPFTISGYSGVSGASGISGSTINIQSDYTANWYLDANSAGFTGPLMVNSYSSGNQQLYTPANTAAYDFQYGMVIQNTYLSGGLFLSPTPAGIAGSANTSLAGLLYLNGNISANGSNYATATQLPPYGSQSAYVNNATSLQGIALPASISSYGSVIYLFNDSGVTIKVYPYPTDTIVNSVGGSYTMLNTWRRAFYFVESTIFPIVY